MILKDLELLGLDNKEARMYLSLLELGEANISTLVKKTGIKRTTTYDVLEQLKKKDLVGLTKKKKRTLYIAEDPRILEQQIETRKQKLNAVLPELLSLMRGKANKPDIRYYEGVVGIEHAYKDTLNYPDKELVAWMSDEAFSVLSPEFIYDFYLPARVKNKIWVRVIAPDSTTIHKYQTDDKKWLKQTRTVSAKQFPFDVEINLYGTRSIAIMSFKEQFAMIIESKQIWRTLKSVFEMNWLIAESDKKVAP